MCKTENIKITNKNMMFCACKNIDILLQLVWDLTFLLVSYFHQVFHCPDKMQNKP